jgi:hypothetical protein
MISKIYASVNTLLNIYFFFKINFILLLINFYFILNHLSIKFFKFFKFFKNLIQLNLIILTFLNQFLFIFFIFIFLV